MKRASIYRTSFDNLLFARPIVATSFFRIARLLATWRAGKRNFAKDLENTLAPLLLALSARAGLPNCQ
jgi:hypothetical protein